MSTGHPDGKPKRRRRYAWIRYVPHPNGDLVADMSGFHDWGTVDQIQCPNLLSHSYQLNNPWLMIENPGINERVPRLQRIEWKEPQK
jgi:hypothetical protein